MKLPELLTVYRRRREDAERHGSTASVAQMYGVVIGELEELELVVPEQWLTTDDVAAQRSESVTTIRRRCKRGDFPGAEKTSGEHGDWRIPASVVFRAEPEFEDRGRAPRILDED